MPNEDSPYTLGPCRVLVTGASGFVGRSLVTRLKEQGCEVHGLCRSQQPELTSLGVTMHAIDITDTAAARAACEGMDIVFHTAAKVGIWGPHQEFLDTNVSGTQAIINGCRDFLVKKLVYTSTPSVVFNGRNIAGDDESLPYGKDIPCSYPATKVVAEKAVLAAHENAPGILKTVALRPHLIWGPGDPNLIPRVLAKAQKGQLRIVGDGANRVDLSYIDNVVDAHIAAAKALDRDTHNPGGKAYFISNDEPVVLWDWINQLLKTQSIDPINRKLSLKSALRIGRVMEGVWKLLSLKGEPPMTRFVASELAKDHWFDISAAKRDLGYQPRVSMEQGTARLLSSLNPQ